MSFGYSTTAYLPLTFAKTAAGNSNIDFATWGTNPKPGPTNNGTVPEADDMTGQGDSITTAIDRFSDIHTSGPVTANLTSLTGLKRTIQYFYRWNMC